VQNPRDQANHPSHSLLRLAFVLAALHPLHAQQAIQLPPAPPITAPVQQPYSFASDGPIGPGWTRPDEIARTYFPEQLPAFFERTLTLTSDIPDRGKLSWIFTGPHAGFTIELTASRLHLIQRFYDSTALSTTGNFPDKTTQDDTQQFTGHPRTLTVILDAHLAIRVLLNNQLILQQTCVFDVTRHQLMFSGPRNQHLVASGALLRPSTAQASISIDPAHHHQTIIGFGGSPSIPAYDSLTPAGKEAYWRILKRYNLLLDREYPMGTQLKPDLSNLDLLADATPHYYGDNFPNGEVSSFDYSRHALALGGAVIYELWALPPWATEPFHPEGKPVIDAWGRSIRIAAKPDEYARIVVTYCRMLQQRTGQLPAIVGLGNEVEQPPEIFARMAIAVRHALDQAGFQSVKIHLADASYLYLGVGRAEALRRNPAAWAAIDFTAAHEYDFQEFFANPDLFDDRLAAMKQASAGKTFLATELCLNDPHLQEPSYRIAFNMGQLYQKNLTELDAATLMYCWLLLDVEQPTFGSSRSLLVPDRMDDNQPVPSSFQLRVLGVFSRHVLKGMQRIDTHSSNPDLLTAAFADSTDSTLIVMNRANTAQILDLHGTTKPFTELERTSPYLQNQPTSTIPSTLVIQPGEILTLSTLHAESMPAKGHP
jgi:O-glycosyl hydrolase